MPLRLPTSTGPAPGTGYSSPDSWWKDPLGDLIEGASGQLESALGINDPDYVPPPPVTEARFIPAPVATPTLLLLGGLGALYLWFRK